MSRLNRFRAAQSSPHTGFESALEEIRSGGKHGHWIWYVFPQLSGLGSSALSQTFSIDGEEEAVEFLRDSELRSRLLTIAEAVADQLKRGTTLRKLMGSDVDARKLVSSLTLFEYVAGKLPQAGNDGAYSRVAKLAGEVLMIAASQGYPRCAYTLSRLGPTS